MPRPTYSIDLPSPKHFEATHIDDRGSDDGDDGLDIDFELQNLHVPRHGRSISQASAALPQEVSWKTVPHKNQLAILSYAIFADFFHVVCLQTVMFHQLRSFNEKASDAKIAWQAGILQGSFMAAQTVSAAVWEKLSDSKSMGRKRVLLTSFIGTSLSCVGLAFAQSFEVAILCRMLAGCVNSTTATARKTVVEMVETKFHPLALLLLPMASNIAYIIAPILAGLSSNLYGTFPSLFGPNSLLGRKRGFTWLKEHPFSIPHLLSAIVVLIGGMVIYLGLVETLPARRFFRDPGLELAAAIQRRLPRLVKPKRTHYTRLSVNDGSLLFEAPASPTTTANPQIPKSPSKHRRTLSVRRTWTASTLFTLVATGLLHFHIGAFASLWPSYLSISNDAPSRFHAIFYHSDEPVGGLSFTPLDVGFSMAIVGVLGLLAQICLYPNGDLSVGTARPFSYALILFPLTYALIPCLVLVPQGTPLLLWICVIAVLSLQVLARTLALPASFISPNDCSPHATVLCAFQGMGQSITAPSNALGSSIAGALLAMGLGNKSVGAAWWAIAGVSAFGFASGFQLRDERGRGPLILLQDDDSAYRDNVREL